MPRKKKKFIDKKKAQQYVVVHRSQQDPLYNDPSASKFVLMPVNDRATAAQDKARIAKGESAATKTDQKDSRRLPGDRVDEHGLALDGYDYSKHMKTIGRGGTFVAANGQIVNSLSDVFNKTGLSSSAFGSENLNDRREQLEAIAIDTGRMPSDMREILDGGNEDGRFEEMLDDFVIDAAQEAESGDDDAPKPFDFRAHLAMLLAKEDEKTKGRRADARSDDEDEELMEVMNAGTASGAAVDVDAPDRNIDGFFDVVMQGYGDEEIGELEEDDPRLQAGLSDMGSLLLQNALAEFEESQKELDKVSNKKKAPGPAMTAVQAAIAKAMARAQEGQASLAEAEPEKEGEEAGEEEQAEEEQAEDNVMNDTWFKRKQKNPWDCQSIVSTYSNLDNRPGVISYRKNIIRLSKKTGLPLAPRDLARRKQVARDGVGAAAAALQRLQLAGAISTPSTSMSMAALAEGMDFESCTGAITSKRDKNETSEERRQRKKLVKAERKARRRQKKETSAVYKDAGKKLRKHVFTNKMAGKTIVRF